jgi:hypothetical protein
MRPAQLLIDVMQHDALIAIAEYVFITICFVFALSLSIMLNLEELK